VRPFDVLGLLFARLGIDGGTSSGDSATPATVTVVEGVVADGTGREWAELDFGSGEGTGRVLSAGSSSIRSFSLRARVSRATESGIGRGTTSIYSVRNCGDEAADEAVIPSRNLRGEF
jgi:hypothetical protein